VDSIQTSNNILLGVPHKLDVESRKIKQGLYVAYKRGGGARKAAKAAIFKEKTVAGRTVHKGWRWGNFP